MLCERRVRVIGLGGRGAYGPGGGWGEGRPKAPNPQAPSPRETSIFNHQTGNSDAWRRIRTLKYAWERLAVGVFLGKARRIVAGFLRYEGRSFAYHPRHQLCATVISADARKQGGALSRCSFLATCEITADVFRNYFYGRRSIWRLVRLCPYIGGAAAGEADKKLRGGRRFRERKECLFFALSRLVSLGGGGGGLGFPACGIIQEIAISPARSGLGRGN